MCLICARIDDIKQGRNPYFVAELNTGYVVLGDHQYFHGYTLFLCKLHDTELFLLEPDFRSQFLFEMSVVAKAVATAFGAEKMNYELLGNGDTHLHWHLFPRRNGDMGGHGMSGKGPVWWVPPEEMYDDVHRPSPKKLDSMRASLRARLRV